MYNYIIILLWNIFLLLKNIFKDIYILNLWNQVVIKVTCCLKIYDIFTVIAMKIDDLLHHIQELLALPSYLMEHPLPFHLSEVDKYSWWKLAIWSEKETMSILSSWYKIKYHQIKMWLFYSMNKLDSPSVYRSWNLV